MRCGACAADEVERDIAREVDSVRLRRVISHLADARRLIGGLHLVTAVAAESLVSEHVAADTSDVRSEAR
jgi:hypothetical protein